MKILLLSNGYGTVNRGAERYSEDVYNLLKDDYEIEIISAKDVMTKTRDRIHIPWRNGKAYLEAYYFGRKLYQNRGFFTRTRLFLNNSGFVGSYWCNKIRKKRDIPFITFERGGGREERLNNLFKPDLISYLTQVSFEESKYKKKVLLPIGINTDVMKLDEPELLKDLERPIIFSPSALVSFKRIHLTIEAMTHTRGTLVQTSNGNLKEDIVSLGKKQLGKRFVYSEVDRNTLEAIYQHCDVVVNASLREAFGIVYLEAMKYGKPIVTEIDSKRAEIVGNAGILTHCDNGLLYARDIERAANTKGWEESIKNQLKKYDWKYLKPKYLKAIEVVVESRQK